MYIPFRHRSPDRPHPDRPHAARLLTRVRAPLLVLVLALLPLSLLTLTGCTEVSPEEKEEIREEIRATLLEYLPLLAEAYRTGDTSVVAPYTTEKEQAILEKNIHDLAQQGRTMDTELLELTIEDLNLVKRVNAYVTTLEEWRVTAYALGTEQVVGENERQTSRVRYQLKKVDGQWEIRARNRVGGE